MEPSSQHSAASVQDALTAAVQLLAVIEGQIRLILGIDPSGSLLADAEQLQQVPPALLQSLEETVALVQGLRDQLQQATNSEQPDISEAVAVAACPSSWEDPSGADSPPPAAQRCVYPVRAASAHARSAAREQVQQHSRASVCRSLPQPCKDSSSVDFGARSSRHNPDATDWAVAEWHQSKLQQQQDAALVQEQQMAQEQQMLSTLAAMEDAAHAAHEQELQQTKHLGRCVSLLQVLIDNEQMWAQYIAAHQETLDTCM